VASADVSANQSILLSEYMIGTDGTDILEEADLPSVLQGLFGEVGEIMSTAKKVAREGKAYRESGAYVGFRRAAEEEFGDALWYLAAVCRRVHITLDDIFSAAANGTRFQKIVAASDRAGGTLAHLALPIINVPLDVTLLNLPVPPQI